MDGLRVLPIPDNALGNTSYLVEVGDGLAISIDPRRDVDEHLALTAENRLRIRSVLETHLHADFVSGSRELAASGAEVIAASDARLGFSNTAAAPGERLAVGTCTIDVLATPGHTPEHVAFLIGDGTAQAVFSGGSLIVGGAARTDLTGAERTEALARAQFASLRALASLSDDTALYPTHGGGSFCSSTRARSAFSTIGAERASNPLLGIEDEDEFVETLRRGFGGYPRYFAHLREVNRRGPELLGSLPDLPELSPTEAQRALDGGAWLIDTRPVDDWARAHSLGAISIELRDAFASWLGWVVPFAAPFVLMLDADRVADAVRMAHRIGYDQIRGWLSFESWLDGGLPTASTDALDPEQASERREEGALILDVRQRAEFEARHIAGATHLELGDIIAGKTPDARVIITYCGHGERSATAASLLEQRGIDVANLRGGSAAWRAAGLGFES
jgi:glyoxylase-like metal-dependent hydrolase (beta-lactamase superfamily II)/rhodanese-related sulfurtransferase